MILGFIGYVNIGHKVLKCARKQFTDSIINISPQIMPRPAVFSARCSAQIGSRKLQVSKMQCELMCCSVARYGFLLVTTQAPSCFCSVALLSLGSWSSLVLLLLSVGGWKKHGRYDEGWLCPRHGKWCFFHIELSPIALTTTVLTHWEIHQCRVLQRGKWA